MGSYHFLTLVLHSLHALYPTAWKNIKIPNCPFLMLTFADLYLSLIGLGWNFECVQNVLFLQLFYDS